MNEYTRQIKAHNWEKLLTGLLEITKGCPEDMHEPDNNGVSATVTVIGNHLDNAMGTAITDKFHDGTPCDSQEYLVILKRGRKEVRLNLADLLAMARQLGWHRIEIETEGNGVLTKCSCGWRSRVISNLQFPGVQSCIEASAAVRAGRAHAKRFNGE